MSIQHLLLTVSLLTVSAQAYVVQPGDTLFSIARRVGVSVAELQRLNNLGDTALKVGQTITLPGEVPNSSVLPSPAPLLPTAPLPSASLPTLTCGPAVTAPTPPVPLPAVVTGKVSFYAAVYDPGTVTAGRAYAIGPANVVMPLASTYKPAVLWAALRDVDGGRLKLNTPLTTTEANRSIEDYTPGTNPLLKLAHRAIEESENTAADILHRTVGTERVATLVSRLSPCTNVLLTTKTFWAAQAGMLPDLIPATDHATLLGAAAQYQRLSPAERLAFASRLNAASLKVSAPALLQQLDLYFGGPTYDPSFDTTFQNTSTARAFTDLTAALYMRSGLKPQTRQLMREIMAKGCCHPKKAPFTYTYWGSKAGSGWRLLNLTGYVELPDGRALAYTYLNHESNTLDAEVMEEQIIPVTNWIGAVLGQLSK